MRIEESLEVGRGHAVGLYTRLLTRNHLDADPPASRLSAGRCKPKPAPDAPPSGVHRLGAIAGLDYPTGESACARDIRARATKTRPCCRVCPHSLRLGALSLPR